MNRSTSVHVAIPACTLRALAGPFHTRTRALASSHAAACVAVGACRRSSTRATSPPLSSTSSPQP
eukprot:6175447-Pleurochrysis_carterae.AAC.1